MIQPHELKLGLPVTLANGVVSTTTKVWDILVSSKNGDLETVKRMAAECHELLYAQYNYTPPIHFAVREGHKELVTYLLDNGAHDPDYKIYPFQESLQVIARHRGYEDIAVQLDAYADNPARHKYKGDNGEIHYDRSAEARAFEQAVDKEDMDTIELMLKEHPEFAHDHTFFWGEGIMMMPAKEGNRELVQLLMQHGARVPDVLKWAQYYYFERTDMAAFLLENGMNPNVMSWHHVTLLHDMAQKGHLDKAKLLVEHGADINAVDEEYRLTPLGMAKRWGHADMIEFLLSAGAQ